MALSFVRHHSDQGRVREVAVILLTLFAIFLAISFISYHPSDPSLNSVGTSNVARNWGGVVGGYFADVAYQLLGLTSFLLPIICLAIVGYIVFRPQLAGHAAKTAGFLIMLIAIASLLNLIIGEMAIDGQEIPAGGLLGTISGGILVKYLNIAGAYLFLLCSVLVSLTLTTKFSFVALWEGMARLSNRNRAHAPTISTPTVARKKWTWNGWKKKPISFRWGKHEESTKDNDASENHELENDNQDITDVQYDNNPDYSASELNDNDTDPVDENISSDEDIEIIELDPDPPAGASASESPPEARSGFRKFFPSFGKKVKKKRGSRRDYKDLQP